MGNREFRALVVDPQDVTRWGVAQLISQFPGYLDCVEANSLADISTLEMPIPPALIVCEFVFSDGTVFDLLELCRSKHWNSRVLLCSGVSDRQLVAKAVAAGASGYVSKFDPLEQLRQSILKTLSGQITISSYLNQPSRVSPPHKLMGVHSQQAIDKLTEREQEIFGLVAQGMDVTEIAQQLCIATKTVEAHRQNIRKKMGLRSMSELIGKAAVWLHQGG